MERAAPMRPFATHPSDLDVDFRAPRVELAVALLRRCAGMGDEAWDLAVGERIEALVALAALERGGELPVTVRCPNQACREAIEIALAPAELRAFSAATERDHEQVHAGGSTWRVRRATGRDQRAWREARWDDAACGRRAMLDALVQGEAPAIGTTAWEAIEAALDRMDPLVDFRPTVACPACGSSAAHALDLEAEALAALRRAQERMLHAVAGLALRLHWNEAEIFALPAWRRERYLALVQAQA